MNYLIPDYIDAIQAEILMIRDILGESIHVHTIYFGGGTPSLIPISSITRILNVIDSCFSISSNPEISLEANPGTLSRPYLLDMVSAGINRLSLGMQSANSEELIFLERQHDFNDVVESLTYSRQVGLSNINLDLIFGLPNQSIDAWKKTLTKAINLDPEHFSVYALSIEDRTPMKAWVEKKLFPLPDPDIAAEMYEFASELLSGAGYYQYEISNWAKLYSQSEAGMKLIREQVDASAYSHAWECEHNLQYWRNLPYYGFGAGAHSFKGGYRVSNILSPKVYIKQLTKNNTVSDYPKTPVTEAVYPIDKSTEMSETMMMGLRLTNEGVSRKHFQIRFQIDFYDVFRVQIEKLLAWGLVKWCGEANDVLKLTSRGRLLGNRVFSEFL